MFFTVTVYVRPTHEHEHERFRCKLCRWMFQLTYRYEARKPDIKNQIVEMSHYGAGVRHTARMLKVGGINTVMRT